MSLTIGNSANLTKVTISSGDLFPVLDISAVSGSGGSHIRYDDLRSGILSGVDITSSGELYASGNLRIGHSTLPYSSTGTLNFVSQGFQTVTLTGAISFISSDLESGRSKTIRIIGDGSSRALSFPTGWKFVGSTAPTGLASGKVAILTATSFGNTDFNVIAAYSAEP